MAALVKICRVAKTITYQISYSNMVAKCKKVYETTNLSPEPIKEIRKLLKALCRSRRHISVS